MKGRSTDDESSGQDGYNLRSDSFATWIERSPQNVRSFLCETALNLELAGLDAAHAIDLDTLVARAQADLAKGNLEDSNEVKDPSPS